MLERERLTSHTSLSLSLSLQITSIDVKGLMQLSMIQTLDLQNNSVSQVPPQLGTITTLKSVPLHH